MSSHRKLWRRSIAWSADHGSWVFFLSPLIIGLSVGDNWTPPVAYLVVAAVCGFLSRQPLTIAVKALSGRRAREDLAPAIFWSLIYATIGSIHVLGLVLRGMGYLLYLAIPGLGVFAWYLYLIWRRDERHKPTLEILGAGVLALTAPAGLWAGIGRPEPLGWLLWALTWGQSAASILYVHLRLQQRSLEAIPSTQKRLLMGLPALATTSLNTLIVGALGVDGMVSAGLVLAYLPQWGESLLGVFRPALGQKPTQIGVRQLAISTLYTLIFIWSW